MSSWHSVQLYTGWDPIWHKQMKSALIPVWVAKDHLIITSPKFPSQSIITSCKGVRYKEPIWLYIIDIIPFKVRSELSNSISSTREGNLRVTIMNKADSRVSKKIMPGQREFLWHLSEKSKCVINAQIKMLFDTEVWRRGSDCMKPKAAFELSAHCNLKSYVFGIGSQRLVIRRVGRSDEGGGSEENASISTPTRTGGKFRCCNQYCTILRVEAEG